MNLLINAEALRPPITGIGNYTYHLIEQYLALGLCDSIHCFTGTDWCSGSQQLATSAALRNTSLPADNPGQKSLAARARELVGKVPGTKRLYDAVMDHRFQRFANGQGSAIYHETNYILKPFRGPCVTTVHDLSHVHFPQYHPEHVVKRLNRQLPESLARADIVLTVSNIVRDELLAHYRLAPAKVITIYEGSDPQYSPRTPDETNPVLRQHGLEHNQYILMVATLEPRKGIDVLLDAWSSLPLAMRQDCPLVLTGSSGWRNGELRSRLESFVQEGTVKHLGYVSSQLLPVLFAGARVFCYPSVYEGFGLPVLDAMSSGVPVICRSGTSMAEFAQGACVLCESPEPEELAHHLQHLMRDASLQALWGEKGLQQARSLTWERCARETWAVYEQLAG